MRLIRCMSAPRSQKDLLCCQSVALPHCHARRAGRQNAFESWLPPAKLIKIWDHARIIKAPKKYAVLRAVYYVEIGPKI